MTTKKKQASVPQPALRKRAGKRVTIEFPPQLHKQIVRAARSERRAFGPMVRVLAERAMRAPETAG